ncbi:uncharacterized protein LY79DRAFT_367821 [Colletotrichum navitas]|uniref:Uncharacterized protein n=1 Tax=Colletotrichum navitas TaxID=681940 RepID=A0AAD8PRF9_9PEZI|nr:uncharacterized protein LY79DRAFT_367821 [Colletotrichum navitas]KAK1574385.1 hypothetical protein LY79DRAFT_367821 [Colletotrichum navitas]
MRPFSQSPGLAFPSPSPWHPSRATGQRPAKRMQKITSHLTPCCKLPKLLPHRGDRHLVGKRRACDSQLDPIICRWQVASCSPNAQGPALTRRHTPACCLPFPPVTVEIPSATKVMRHLIGLEWPPKYPAQRLRPLSTSIPQRLARRSRPPLVRRPMRGESSTRGGELDGRAVAHFPLYRN